MSVSQLPNGRYRSQVYDGATGKSVSAARILGLEVASFATRREAVRARERARLKLLERTGDQTTVRGWWDVWTTHSLFQRPKAATNINNRERTGRFVDRYGHLRLADVDRRVVSEWLMSGENQSTVKFLRTMFSDAMSPNGGERITSNPFAGAGVRSKGNAEKQPPSVDEAWQIIRTAWELCPPGFAAWLQTACFSGMRPCELDALAWSHVDLDRGVIRVDREFCSKSMTFARPKNDKSRWLPIHQPVAEALALLPREGEFVFVNSQGGHWHRASRQYQWDRVRRASGWDKSLYLATRHFAGWWMYQVLMLPAEDVAEALGHRDRGQLVRMLYGHFEGDAALERVRARAAAYFAEPRDELAERRSA